MYSDRSPLSQKQSEVIDGQIQVIDGKITVVQRQKEEKAPSSGEINVIDGKIVVQERKNTVLPDIKKNRRKQKKEMTLNTIAKIKSIEDNKEEEVYVFDHDSPGR